MTDVSKYIEWINTSEREELFEREGEAGLKKWVKLPWISAISPWKAGCKTAPSAL